MHKKQLDRADLTARAQRVQALASVTPLSQAPQKHVRYFTSLTDTRLRTLRETDWGIYIAESSKVIRRAIAAGHLPLCFIMSEKWADDLADILTAHPDIPAYVGSEEELETITGFHLHRGALAAVRRPAPLPLDHLLGLTQRVAVLEDIVDHTNVGAIFRSAAALGIGAILVTPRCADPLYRRSIRVSMGAVFQVPWGRLDCWPSDLDLLRQHGFVTAAMALAKDSLSLTELADLDYEKLAIIVGSEGHGLGKATLAESDHTVTIPMSAGVDSLNVAAAAAVSFWETRPTR